MMIQFSKLQTNNMPAKAFTITELVVAISITATIALVATTFTVTMMDSQERVEEEYQMARSANIVLSRVEDMIRSSRLVLKCLPHTLMLWTSDQNDYGLVNLSEMAIIEYDSALGVITLQELKVPVWATPADVESIDGDTTLTAAMKWFAGSTPLDQCIYGASTVIAENITSAIFSCDIAAPMSRKVTIDIDFNLGQTSRDYKIAATLRQDITDQVLVSGGDYYLSSEYGQSNPAFADISNVMAN